MQWCRVVLGLVFVVLLVLSAAASGSDTEPGMPDKTVKVTAQRFKYVPARIKVEQGTVLRIELSSRDVEHGFEIVGTEIETSIPARGQGTAEVVFASSQAGRFRFRCSHNCGAGHASMRGVIVVEAVKKERNTQ